MSENTKDTLALNLLSSLVRALSHQIRTPLSVISNDLSYFKNLLPEGECQRSLERCKEISNILGAALVDGGRASAAESVSVRIFLTEIFEGHTIIGLEALSDNSMVVDKPKLQFAFRALLQNLIEIAAAPIQISCRPGPKLTITFEQEYVPHVVTLKGQSFMWMHQFWNVALGSDNVAAPLIDAIFVAQGFSASLTVDEKIELRVQFN